MEILAAIALIVIAMLALGVGVLFGRPAIKGSCGGLACNGACQSCEQGEKRS